MEHEQEMEFRSLLDVMKDEIGQRNYTNGVKRRFYTFNDWINYICDNVSNKKGL